MHYCTEGLINGKTLESVILETASQLGLLPGVQDNQSNVLDAVLKKAADPAVSNSDTLRELMFSTEHEARYERDIYKLMELFYRLFNICEFRYNLSSSPHLSVSHENIVIGYQREYSDTGEASWSTCAVPVNRIKRVMQREPKAYNNKYRIEQISRYRLSFLTEDNQSFYLFPSDSNLVSLVADVMFNSLNEKISKSS